MNSIYDGRIVMVDEIIDAQYHKIYHVFADGTK